MYIFTSYYCCNEAETTVPDVKAAAADLQLILLIDLDQDMLVLLMPLKKACLHMHADHDHGILHTDQSGTTPRHVLPLTDACSFAFKLMVTSLSVRLI